MNFESQALTVDHYANEQVILVKYKRFNTTDQFVQSIYESGEKDSDTRNWTIFLIPHKNFLQQSSGTHALLNERENHFRVLINLRLQNQTLMKAIMQNGIYFILAADNTKSSYKREGSQRDNSAIYSRASTQLTHQSFLENQDQQSSQLDETSSHQNDEQKVNSNSATFNSLKTNFKEDYSKNQIYSESDSQNLIMNKKNSKMNGNLSRTSLKNDQRFLSPFKRKGYHSPLQTQKRGLISVSHQKSRYTSYTPRNSNILCDLFGKETLQNLNSHHQKPSLKQGTQSAMSKFELNRKVVSFRKNLNSVQEVSRFSENSDYYGVLDPVLDSEIESEHISEQEEDLEVSQSHQSLYKPTSSIVNPSQSNELKAYKVKVEQKMEENASKKIAIDKKSKAIKKDQEPQRKAKVKLPSVEYVALNGKRITISMQQQQDYKRFTIKSDAEIIKSYKDTKFYTIAQIQNTLLRDLNKSHRELFKNPSEFDLYFPQTENIVLFCKVCGHKDSNGDGRFHWWLNKHGDQSEARTKKPRPRNFKIKAEPRNDSTQISTNHQEAQVDSKINQSDSNLDLSRDMIDSEVNSSVDCTNTLDLSEPLNLNFKPMEKKTTSQKDSQKQAFENPQVYYQIERAWFSFHIMFNDRFH
eukprot:403342534